METTNITKEQFKKFIADHKKQIAIGCGLVIAGYIIHGKGIAWGLKVVNRDLNEMFDSGSLVCINNGKPTTFNYEHTWF